ncbi:hypothetical protein [Labrys wisconsinensis]|uniref:Lysylphosphatidylglycerol synthetase-like protein (DUF2156 family) n=1 Tax=Labrys wisconsinensis TaxID=425677 RepID=A0ABU0J8D5_9HYPH|nr:hypothetical protein [Labrys wisconsinensis]MDQ0469693.1 lysylphosphatidylglycerol synthetase-like protein (DUF2156 family) [Labrys wisconsinensis]
MNRAAHLERRLARLRLIESMNWRKELAWFLAFSLLAAVVFGLLFTLTDHSLSAEMACLAGFCLVVLTDLVVPRARRFLTWVLLFWLFLIFEELLTEGLPAAKAKPGRKGKVSLKVRLARAIAATEARMAPMRRNASDAHS